MCKQKLTRHTPITALLLAATLSLAATTTTGCDDLGFGSVSGDVMGQPFQYGSGVADRDARGNYLITLSDTSGFDCYSSPSGNYLSITIASINGPGTYAASQSVTFNHFENNTNYSDSASSGSVTIDEIDDSRQIIHGSISATNQDSDVSGIFSVEICD